LLLCECFAVWHSQYAWQLLLTGQAMIVQLDDLEDEPQSPKAKWYRRLSFWYRVWPILATCCLLVIAALLRKFGPEQASH